MKSIIKIQIPNEINITHVHHMKDIIKSFENNRYADIISSMKKLGTISPDIFDYSMINNIENSFHQMKWNTALDTLNDSVDKTYNFYIGPIKSIDNDKDEFGFILLKRKILAKKIYNKVKNLSKYIGEIFNFPCGFNNRYVEFYDVVFASNQFRTSAANRIALFSPFYFGKVDLDQVKDKRRSIIFHNIIKARFKNITKPLLENVLLDGKTAAILKASDKQIDKAIILWICLHELMHSSGPIPFFGSEIKKMRLGVDYAHLEEARVDMSSYVALSSLDKEFGDLATITKELILFERLFRSARQKNFANYNGANNFDLYHGLLWSHILENAGAFDNSNESQINVDSNKVLTSVKNFLIMIYKTENAATISKECDAYASLKNHSLRIKKLLNSKYSNCDVNCLQHIYNKFNGPIDFDLTFYLTE
jgi:hypothetical protein